MTYVKFCGLRTPADTAMVNRLRPDFIGMVLAPGRRRTIGLDTAMNISDNLDPEIVPVGVFVDQPIEEIERFASSGVIKAVQLHGSESEEYVEEVKSRTGLKVIRAFTVSSIEEVKAASESEADIIMFDAGAGTGRTFDWSLLSACRRRFFLAGGLTPENVYQAILDLEPIGVDVSSGIETEGNKDELKMQRFMDSVCEADMRMAGL